MIYDTNPHGAGRTHPESFFMSAEKSQPLSEQDDEKSSPG